MFYVLCWTLKCKNLSIKPHVVYILSSAESNVRKGGIIFWRKGCRLHWCYLKDSTQINAKTSLKYCKKMHFYLYNSGAAAVFMCLRMDVLTVKRRRWWEGGGGDSATVAVHQQRWDYSHHYITVCRLERADGATLSLVPAKNTLCLFCFHSWTHKISRTPVQSRQCTWRDWLSCSFVSTTFPGKRWWLKGS